MWKKIIFEKRKHKHSWWHEFIPFFWTAEVKSRIPGGAMMTTTCEWCGYEKIEKRVWVTK